MGGLGLSLGALFLGMGDSNLVWPVHLSPVFHITDALNLRTPGLPFSYKRSADETGENSELFFLYGINIINIVL